MTAATDRPAPDVSDAANQVSRRTWAGFAAMCAGMFAAILDVQILATSLPNIQASLAVSPDQMSWIETAYLVAHVVAIPLTGLSMHIVPMRCLFA